MREWVVECGVIYRCHCLTTLPDCERLKTEMPRVNRQWAINHQEAVGLSNLHRIYNFIKNKKVKTKKISEDLIDLNGVCDYFGLSESTVRRKIRDTREGKGNFVLPLFGSKCRIVFRRSDIESWKGEDSEVVTFTPTMLPPNPQVVQSNEQVRKGLEAYGIKLPVQAKGR